MLNNFDFNFIIIIYMNYYSKFYLYILKQNQSMLKNGPLAVTSK